MNKYAGLIEQPESWFIPLSGYEITLICVGYELQIHSQGSDLSASIAIGDKFNLLTGDELYNFNVGTESSTLGPVLGLLHKRIESVSAMKDGHLNVIIDSGISLSVAPDHAYEAWDVSISNGIRVVCMPGGELAIWDAK